jgi:hypothetical protein
MARRKSWSADRGAGGEGMSLALARLRRRRSPDSGRVPEAEDLLLPSVGAGRDRSLEGPLQPGQTALGPRLPAAALAIARQLPTPATLQSFHTTRSKIPVRSPRRA